MARVYGAALLLPLMLAGQSSAVISNPPSETAFKILPVEFSYPGIYRSFRQVDFPNLPLHIFDTSTKSATLPLRKGKCAHREQFRFEGAMLDTVRYLSGSGSKEQYALVFYTYSYGGGSSSQDGLGQVFALSDSRLRIIQQVRWDEHFNPPGNEHTDLDRSNSILTIRSARYLEGDAHCCISGMDVVTLHWNGSIFSQVRMTTERLPHAPARQPR
jgi:hypothetical protein